MVKGWKTVNIPEDLYDELQKFLDDKKVKANYSFTSTSEFLRSAIRKEMRKIKDELKID